MTSDDIKSAHLVLTYFSKQYQNKFNSKPFINRNRAKYQVLDMLEDMSVSEVKKLIDYYISTSKSGSLSEFMMTYHELLLEKTNIDQDKINRKSLLESTAESVRQFRERYKK